MNLTIGPAIASARKRAGLTAAEMAEHDGDGSVINWVPHGYEVL